MPLCDQAAVLAKLFSSMAFCCQQAIEMSVTQICANRSNSGRSETLYIYMRCVRDELLVSPRRKASRVLPNKSSDNYREGDMIADNVAEG